MKYKSVLFIANPVAGRFKKKGSDWISILSKKYNEAGMEVSIYYTCGPADVAGVRGAVKIASCDLILSVGGDGTLNDVIHALPDYRGVIGILPAGSGNDAARITWGSSDPPIGLLQDFSRLSEENIDIWKCNETYFVCGCGIGFEGAVVNRLSHTKLVLSPTFKYWWAILREIVFYQEILYETTTFDNRKFSGNALMLSCANGPTVGGGIRISPNANPTDGMLNFHIVSKMNPLKRLFNLPRIEKGKHLGLKEVESTLVKEIQIDTKSTAFGHADGQLISGNRFVFKLSHQLTFLTG